MLVKVNLLIIDKNNNRILKDGHTYTDDNLVYKNDSGTYKLVAYIGSDDTVTLPSKLIIDGASYDYTIHQMIGAKNVVLPDDVTSINDYAFSDNPLLTSVTLGKNVSNIGDYAFSDCKNLKDINIPIGVTSIGNHSFSGCTSLTSINIPVGVTSIGNHSFSDCTGLTSINIPNSVTDIGEHAFYNCSSLGAVYITDISAWCGIEFGNEIGNPLYYTQKLYLNDNLITELVIPDDVTEISKYAFYNCSSLTSVTLPDKVTSIADYSFYLAYYVYLVIDKDGNNIYRDGCKCTDDGFVYKRNGSEFNLVAYIGCEDVVTLPHELVLNGIKVDYTISHLKGVRNVIIPESVTSIGEYTFSGCSSLTSVTIPNSVTSIGRGAFSGCSSLEAVYITDIAAWCGIEFDYGANPLENTHNLYLNGELVTELVIPYGVTSIGDYAFEYCSFASITIPDSVTSIDDFAFYGCSGLTSITIPNSVTQIGDRAFYDCTGLTSITIPDSVTSIGSHAFSDCKGLTSVTIGNGVTSIGNYAFYYCSGLTSIIIPDSVTSIGRSAFGGCSSLTSVTIPNSVTSIGDRAFGYCSNLMEINYLGTKAQWKNIGKDTNWASDAGDFIVHCTDGDTY